jgi:hypothetical protein
MSALHRYEVEVHFPGNPIGDLLQIDARHVQHARELARDECLANGLDAPCRVIARRVEEPA